MIFATAKTQNNQHNVHQGRTEGKNKAISLNQHVSQCNKKVILNSLGKQNFTTGVDPEISSILFSLNCIE